MYMKKIILFLFVAQLAIAQPPPNSNAGGNGNGNAGGNGNGNNDPCKNPKNPNCNPVPISGIWILLLGGAIVGFYFHNRKKVTVKS